MNCDSVRQLLLNLDLDAPARRRLAAALAHLDGCKHCSQAFTDFDRLAALLSRKPLAGATDEVDDEPAENTGDGTSEASEATSSIGTTGDEGPIAPATGLKEQTDATPTGGWGAFERRLRAAVAEGHSRPTPRRLWSIGILGSLAASVLVGWVAFQVGQRSGSRDASGEIAGLSAATRPTAPVHPLPLAAIPISFGPADVAQRVRAFGEVDQVFDGRTNWLMLSANATDVGLSDQPDSPAAPVTQSTTTTTIGLDPAGRKLLLVRLNLTRGTEVVSNADLVIVPGTAATVTVPTKQGTPVRYRVVTFADHPTRLAVRVEMPQSGPGAMDATAVLGTSLELQPFRETAAGRLVTRTGAYDLMVAAAPAPQGKL